MKVEREIALFLLLALVCSMPAMAESSRVEQLLSVAVEQLDAPYELFSDAPNSFNCLTFVIYCFNQVASGKISVQGIDGDYEKISSIRNVQPGDIVCFKSSSRLKGVLGYHFGIYVAKGYFIHASSEAGKVTVSKLKNYKKRFVGAVRIF